eukprot:TRINITY_DN548_c0_g1_i4.p1 TRINITY_DN548_c0_g1~~TRINITY_DN548_c0_g1_i4.p1  ORF type:complete len:608 (-),score=90.63 TRINITY_DN548_c0_g1_i4:25-1848(-)
MEDAIMRGDVTWHAIPFSLFAEVSEANLFAYGLTLGHRLDQRFNKTRKIAGSHKDVPGISKAVLPLLANEGIKSIHIGCNTFVACPATPEIFLWDDQKGHEVLTMVHAGFPIYGGNIIIPGFPHAFSYNFTLDNRSPLNASSVIEWFTFLKKTFPFAKIHVDSLDNFTDIVLNNATLMRSLPRFSYEMGDTWLYGIQADPWRVSTFREITRILSSHVKTYGWDSYSDRYARRLLKIPEHNWGLSIHKFLNQTMDERVWANDIFYEHLTEPDFQLLEKGWIEQRSFLFNSSDFIKSIAPKDYRAHALAEAIDAQLENLKPVYPKLEKYVKIPLKLQNYTFSTKYFNIEFNTSNGAIIYLYDKLNNRLWSDPQHPMGKFLYKSYSMHDFDVFNSQYNPYCGIPCGDFSKPGMGNFSDAQHADWEPSVEGIWYSNTSVETILIELQFRQPGIKYYGPPAQVTIEYTFSPVSSQFDINLQWFYKQKTRLSESMWLSFVPIITNPGLWSLDVMGVPINPYEVVANGSRHLHAIWKGISFKDPFIGASLDIISLDCALVAPGDTEHLLIFDGNEQPKVENGMHFNLYNNLWGTAFNQWYDQDAKFRFTLVFGK